ncbi:MAG: hypothetical protein JKY87_07460 [Mariprofundus sp.]|nr:hypothetical protein [Mariprofundus sp.]
MLQFIQLFRQQQYAVTFASTAATTEHMLNLDHLSVSCVPIQVNDSSFDTFICDLQPDLVLFDRFSTEEQFGWRVEKTVRKRYAYSKPSTCTVCAMPDMPNTKSSRPLCKK